jgi:hypothetical protein
LHDLGLPITVPFQGTVRKDGQDRGVRCRHSSTAS